MKHYYKEIIRSLFRYCRAYRFLQKEFDMMTKDPNLIQKKLENQLQYAVSNVPYYKKKYTALLQKKPLGITQFDYLHKTDIANNENSFVSTRYFKPLLYKDSTGGSTGVSLNICNNLHSLIRETFFIDHIFSQIAPRKELKIAVLREKKPRQGHWDLSQGKLILSQYDLNLRNTRIYLDLMHKHQINCLHAYPSSILILCKHIHDQGIESKVPRLKGIITSSETLSRQQKEYILQTFPGATLIDLYGQSEHLAMAYSVNLGYYQFIPQYSWVEFKDTGTYNGENKIFEIIGTNFSNRAMPLIRYSTEDNVEIDQDGNIIGIIGRAQDYLVNKEMELVPCIEDAMPSALRNVITFQYFQQQVGEIEYRIVVNNRFDKTDEKELQKQLLAMYNHKIEPKIIVLDRIERLPSGKQKRLIQELDLKAFH